MIEIRVATPDDARAILDIYSYYIEKTISFEYPVPSEESYRNYIKKVLKTYPYLTVYEDDQLVGYCYASAFRERAAYDWSIETTIYLDKDKMRSGIGTLIYSKLFEILKYQGFTMAYSCIVYPYDISVDFHKKFGYVECGLYKNCAYKNGRWLNVIMMEKEVQPIISTKEYSVPVPFSKISIEKVDQILNDQSS